MNATTNQPATQQRRFEVEVCGRCAGSGRYSFNLIDGDMCYGCRRKGKRYTKRGQAAYDYYVSLCTKPAAELIAGECVTAFGRVCKIERIEHDTQSGESMVGGVMTPYCLPVVVLHLVGGGTSQLFAHTPTLTCPNGEDKRAKLELAYDYQDTLKADGKPRKQRK